MYKKNRLRLKLERLSEKRSELGKYGNEVKAELRKARGQDLKPVGGFTTWGSMGEHVIELLDCDDPALVWVRVDGGLRQPRTMRGVHSVLSRWVYRANKKTTAL